MVRIMDAGREETLQSLAGKKVFCFGMGKRFHYFRKVNPQILISGIIDTYKEVNFVRFDGETVPVWTPEEAASQIDQNTVLVITSAAVEEIMDQLNQLDEFSAVSCYLELMLDDYGGLDEQQAVQYRQLISRLLCGTSNSIFQESCSAANQKTGMKKYQIWQYFLPSNTAASKAREDIRVIAEKLDYQVVKIHCTQGEKGTAAGDRSDELVYLEWNKFLDAVPEYSAVFMQLPAGTRFPEELILRKKEEKKLLFLTCIHDVDGIREKNCSEAQQEEFQAILQLSDFLIVPNNVMARYFLQSGVNRNRLVTLEIFDYLHDKEETDKIFEQSITFAGNLSERKSGFLSLIGQLAPLKIRLYGPNVSENVLSKVENVIYGGSVSAELLPEKLNCGFGLIWDGSRIDTCAGGTGEYLRYNNPHKMSLYLASGLPVVIWSGAAQAKFVEENGVGIVVDSLYDLNAVFRNLTENDYKILCKNVQRISERLKSGHYIRNAIKRIENAAFY